MIGKANISVDKPAQDFDPTLEPPYSSGAVLPACMLLPDGPAPCLAFTKELCRRIRAEVRLGDIAAIIETVENRCMASDGPVTPTLREITEAEFREIWLLATDKVAE